MSVVVVLNFREIALQGYLSGIQLTFHHVQRVRNFVHVSHDS